MRTLRLAGAVVIAFGLAACGSDTAVVMPDVTGKKLDVAKSDIKNAGLGDEIKVEGGGLFGVIDETNWEVCAQSPEPGEVLTATPELTIDRTCDGDSTAPSATPSATPVPDASKSGAPSDEVLTAENNEEFAALLALKDGCDDSIEAFATKYSGQTIQFNGSVSYMTKHGDSKTRYDFLLAPGDEGTDSTDGPNLKYEDVNVL